MKITEYWNCDDLPRGQLKSVCAIQNHGGYQDVKSMLKELRTRSKPKQVHHDASSITFDEGKYIQVITWN